MKSTSYTLISNNTSIRWTTADNAFSCAQNTTPPTIHTPTQRDAVSVSGAIFLTWPDSHWHRDSNLKSSNESEI